MAAEGHEERFPSLSLSDRCGFAEETFAGTRGTDEDAPKAAAPITLVEPSRSTPSGSST